MKKNTKYVSTFQGNKVTIDLTDIHPEYQFIYDKIKEYSDSVPEDFRAIKFACGNLLCAIAPFLFKLPEKPQIRVLETVEEYLEEYIGRVSESEIGAGLRKKWVLIDLDGTNFNENDEVSIIIRKFKDK